MKSGPTAAILLLLLFLSAGRLPAADAGAPDPAQAGIDASAMTSLPAKSWSLESLRELARVINSLPDETAAAGLWLAASAPPRFDTLNIFANALTSASARVKIIAVSILAGERTDDARRLLMNTLALERDPEVVRAAVLGLSHLPQKQAVRGLMDVMFLPGLGDAAMAATAEELTRLTKADVGNNPVDWQDWWLDNEHLFE